MKHSKSNRTKSAVGVSRRDFLRMGGGCMAMSQTALFSSLINMGMTRAALAATPQAGYKAMVCLFLHGGNDSYNMLVPTDPDEYAGYQAARGNLALDSTTLHEIIDGSDGRKYGLHPSMPNTAALYNSNKLSFINNVGSLIEPVNRDTYRNGPALPLGLFSHSDQQRHWQTSVPQSRTQITGWAGRMADYLLDGGANAQSGISLNIAVDHLNILQTGNGVIPYVVDDRSGAEVLAGYGGGSVQDQILTQATDSLLNATYENLLTRTFAQTQRNAIDAAEHYNNSTSVVEFPGLFPNTRLGRSFEQVAKAIGARQALGQSRQMFFVEQGGFDNHDNLLGAQEIRLGEVDAALSAFHDALQQLGCFDEVVTFSISDFARTLNSNGNGSDHAWGGNQIVMGGGLQGGRMYGHYPDTLVPDNELDIGRGRLIPTTSVDEFNAELAMWFGVPNDGTLVDILPNVRNFFPAGAAAPLGFLL